MTSKLDLDFGDIDSKISQVETKQQQVQQAPVKKTSTGVVLSLPTDSPEVWESKDLSDCTGEEFVTWAKRVYPISLEEFTFQLNDVNERVATFNLIFKYHQNLPYMVGNTTTNEVVMN